MADTCGIYKIENNINGHIYVGQSRHIHRRFIEHRSSLNNGTAPNQHLQRAWNKYGEDAFDFSVLEVCEECDLNEKEVFWIELLHSKLDGYNMTLGGGGCSGFKMPKYAVEKMVIFSFIGWIPVFRWIIVRPL